MYRRDFLSLAASTALPPVMLNTQIPELIQKLETAIRLEIPGVRRVDIRYDKADKKVPLMIIALRV